MHFPKHRPQLRQQLLILTFIFSLVIGLIIVMVSNFAFRSYLKNTLIRSTDTSLLFLTDYVDNELNNIDQLILYCQSDGDISTFVESGSTTDSVKKLAAYQALSDYCLYNASYSYLTRVTITNSAGSYIQIMPVTSSSTLNIAQFLPEQDFYHKMLERDYLDYNIGFMPDIAKKTQTVVPLLRPITYKFNAKHGGYIYIEVNAALFSNALDNAYQQNAGGLYLTLGEHSYLYKDGTFTLTEESFSYTEPSTSIDGRNSARVDSIRHSDGSEYLVVSEELAHKGCFVSQMLTEEDINSGLPVFYLLIAFLIVVLFFISILLHHFLNQMINVPVRKIQQRLLQISEGDFSRDMSIEWEHELGDIGKGVNDLAGNINELLRTALEDEKQKMDLEYKLLQSQINPHFLYNTLNSIKWMSVTQGTTGITEMTTALSNLLKSVSKGTRLLIPLSEELILIQNYFTIQQYRYGGTISLEINVEEEALYECHIIKFTLQPLVENAIFHGIEPTGMPGTINIHIYSVSENDLRIDITDHGIGMTAETIERILSDDSVNTSDFFKELGIKNIHQRLQYEFGTDYGITIDSKLGEYTTMSILIPKHFVSH